MRSISAGLSPAIGRRPKPQRSLKPGCAPIATPRSRARLAVRNMICGSPAWNPQATFAEETMSSIAASSPIGQGPNPSPMSQLRSTFMTPPGGPRPSDQDRLRGLHADLEDPLVAVDLGARAHRLGGVVGELHGRAAVRGDHLADDRDRIERPVRDEAPEVVRQERAPAVADAHAALEMPVDVGDDVDVEAVREDRELVLRVLPARKPPVDRLLAALDRVLGI